RRTLHTAGRTFRSGRCAPHVARRPPRASPALIRLAAKSHQRRLAGSAAELPDEAVRRVAVDADGAAVEELAMMLVADRRQVRLAVRAAVGAEDDVMGVQRAAPRAAG